MVLFINTFQFLAISIYFKKGTMIINFSKCFTYKLLNRLEKIVLISIFAKNKFNGSYCKR